MTWHTGRDRPLDVLVVDKTVAKGEYRNTRGCSGYFGTTRSCSATGRPPALDRDDAGYQLALDGRSRTDAERTARSQPSPVGGWH